MKKLLVSMMALSVVAIGSASFAGTLSGALNNAATSVSKQEQKVSTAKSTAAAKKAQAKKDAEAKKAAQQKAVQEKKDALNTLLGK